VQGQDRVVDEDVEGVGGHVDGDDGVGCGVFVAVVWVVLSVSELMQMKRKSSNCAPSSMLLCFSGLLPLLNLVVVHQSV
jgi:hypothetical protein